MKPRGMRARAQVGAEDLRGRHTRSRELVAIGQPQVEVGLSSWRALEPAFEVRVGMTGLPEGVDDFLTHLAAARPQ